MNNCSNFSAAVVPSYNCGKGFYVSMKNGGSFGSFYD